MNRSFLKVLPFFILLFSSCYLNASEPSESKPVLIWYHGAGETPSKYERIWEGEEGIQLISKVLKKHDLIDFRGLENRSIYIGGISLGSVRAREAAAADPERFKGVILAASEQSEDWEKTVVNPQRFPPILYLHGGRDPVPLEKMKMKAERLRALGFRVDFIEEPELGHDYLPEWNEKIKEWIKGQEKIIPG